MIAISLHTVKSAMLEKHSGGGRGQDDTGQRSMVLESLTREEMQRKNGLPCLSLELQATIMGASIPKMLAA
jgi:hypothetical protein